MHLEIYDYESGEKVIGNLLVYKPYKFKAIYTGEEIGLYRFTMYSKNLGTIYLNTYNPSPYLMFVPGKPDEYIISVRIIDTSSFGYKDLSKSFDVASSLGDIIASTFEQSETYYEGEEIEISFADKFTNTTGKPVTYTADVGQIDTNGMWKYTPEEDGTVVVTITAKVGTKEAALTFTLTITRVINISVFEFTQNEQIYSGISCAINFNEYFDAEGEPLMYSLEGVGSIDSSTGVYEHTFTAGGYYDLTITAQI